MIGSLPSVVQRSDLLTFLQDVLVKKSSHDFAFRFNIERNVSFPTQLNNKIYVCCKVFYHSIVFDDEDHPQQVFVHVFQVAEQPFFELVVFMTLFGIRHLFIFDFLGKVIDRFYLVVLRQLVSVKNKNNRESSLSRSFPASGEGNESVIFRSVRF